MIKVPCDCIIEIDSEGEWHHAPDCEREAERKKNEEWAKEQFQKLKELGQTLQQQTVWLEGLYVLALQRGKPIEICFYGKPDEESNTIEVIVEREKGRYQHEWLKDFRRLAEWAATELKGVGEAKKI